MRPTPTFQRLMNIRRWLAGALLITAVGVAARIAITPQEPQLEFDPALGAQHYYRVGNRVVVDVDGQELDETVTSHGIVNYRVTGREPLRLHAAIDLLDMAVNDQPTLSSVDMGGRDRELAAAIRDGFDMTLTGNGEMDIRPTNAAAFKRLSRQFDKRAENPFQQALLGPMPPADIPARAGAEITLDNFQGFEGLTLSVDALDSEHAWLRIDGELEELPSDSPLIRNMAPPGQNIDVSDIHVAARMTVEREHGWLTDMTLVLRLRMALGDKAATMRSITYAHRRDNLLAGAVETPLNAFLRLPPDFITASDLMMAQFSPAFLAPPLHATPDRFDAPDSAQALSAYHDGVILYLDGGNAGRLPYGSLELENAIAYDAQGKRLDGTLAFDTMHYQTEGEGEGGGGWLINLVPLGWNENDPSRIAEVHADIGFRRRPQGEPVTLKLDDQRRVLEHGDARAVAQPLADRDNAWQVTLSTGGERFYWLDPGALPEGVTGQGLLPEPDSDLTPAEQIMLARNDNPRAWKHSLRIEADQPSLELPLLDTDNGDITQTETVRFVLPGSAPAARPAKTLHIDTPVLDERDISLDAIDAPVATATGGLRMTLPVELAEPCGLSAWPEDQNAPTLLWRRVAPDSNAGHDHTSTDWQLTDVQGNAVDVRERAFETVLTCPGTPVWHRVTIEHDMPWRIDLKRATGRWPNRSLPAAEYFSRVQFLDADGRPLRPRLNRGSEEPATDWAQEAAAHSVGDYVDDSGQIRIWGDVAQLLALDFQAPSVKRRWPHAADGAETRDTAARDNAEQAENTP